MICSCCKKTIIGLYLINHHYISKRGNEDDYDVLFCYKEQKVWKNYFKKQEEIFIEKEKQITKEKTITMIKNASSIYFDVDPSNNTCIILNNYCYKKGSI